MNRIIFYTVTLSMIFHHAVSAQRNLAPFTATPPSYFSAAPQTARLLSFNSTTGREKTLLNWTVADNQEADRFELEKSPDGKSFAMAALVFGTDKAGTDSYQFSDKEKKSRTYYYRLKTVGKNGSVDYSQTIMAGPDAIK